MRTPTRSLGPDRLEVGAIVFGAMSFANVYGQGGDHSPDAVAREIAERAYTRTTACSLRLAGAVTSMPRRANASEADKTHQ